MGDVTFEIIVDTKANVETTLKSYLSTKDAHSLMILGFYFNTTDSKYHILVRYRA